MVHADLDVKREGGRWQTVRFLVDSGATYSVLPWRVWRKLGLKPKRSLDFTLIDGTLIQRRVSHCHFRYGDIDAPSPVILGERNDDALLGAFTLEALGLVLNPFERKLQPMRLRLAMFRATLDRPGFHALGHRRGSTFSSSERVTGASRAVASGVPSGEQIEWVPTWAPTRRGACRWLRR